MYHNLYYNNGRWFALVDGPMSVPNWRFSRNQEIVTLHVQDVRNFTDSVSHETQANFNLELCQGVHGCGSAGQRGPVHVQDVRNCTESESTEKGSTTPCCERLAPIQCCSVLGPLA